MDIKQFYLDNYFSDSVPQKEKELWFETNEQAKRSVWIMQKLKQCNHKFHSVYYGSEWVVECEKCEKDVYDLYGLGDANEIINTLIKNQ